MVLRLGTAGEALTAKAGEDRAARERSLGAALYTLSVAISVRSVLLCCFNSPLQMIFTLRAGAALPSLVGVSQEAQAGGNFTEELRAQFLRLLKRPQTPLPPVASLIAKAGDKDKGSGEHKGESKGESKGAAAAAAASPKAAAEGKSGERKQDESKSALSADPSILLLLCRLYELASVPKQADNKGTHLRCCRALSPPLKPRRVLLLILAAAADASPAADAVAVVGFDLSLHRPMLEWLMRQAAALDDTKVSPQCALWLAA